MLLGGRKLQIASGSVKISPMELGQAVALVLLLAVSFTPLAGLPAPCRTRSFGFEITRKMLVQQEKAEREGHQPWRSDARMVARAAISQVDKKMGPPEIGGLGYRVLKKSETRATFLFESADRNDSYRVTVKRFRIRMPGSERTTNTVWWATDVVVTNCPRRTESGPRSAG